jgi:hypothetical protein
VFQAADIGVITTAIRVPAVNAIQERQHRSVRAELLDRTLVGVAGATGGIGADRSSAATVVDRHTLNAAALAPRPAAPLRGKALAAPSGATADTPEHQGPGAAAGA